jgi:hypothetical protein
MESGGRTSEAEQLSRKAVELALAGDTVALTQVYSSAMKPVALPPGRAKLSTKPAPTGSAIFATGRRINGIDPDRIVRRGIFQGMEGRRIIADMTIRENLRLGAFTRSDGEVVGDLDRVLDYSPPQGTHLPRWLPVGRRAADAGNRPRPHGAPEADPHGRALHGAVAAGGEGGISHHPPINLDLGVTVSWPAPTE